MRNTKATWGRARLAVLLACAALAACADGGSGHPASAKQGAAGAGGQHADAGTGAAGAAAKDAGARMVMLTGTLTDFKAKTPIADASMCLTMPARDPMPCATTTAGGEYSLWIRADTDAAVAFHADGFFDQLVLEHVSKDAQLDLEPVATDDLKKQAASVGVTLEDGKGILALNASIAGISFSLSPDSGKLVYFDSSGQPSSSATQTSMPGLGVVFGMEPGRYDIAYQGASQGCLIANLGWPGDAPSQARAVVVANSISEVGMICL